ncbi:MAG: hypothetical protein ACR2Q4_03335 [Geminicoccaceae bacterium]
MSIDLVVDDQTWLILRIGCTVLSWAWNRQTLAVEDRSLISIKAPISPRN